MDLIFNYLMQPTGPMQQQVGPQIVSNQYRPGIAMPPQPTGSVQQLAPQIVAPTGMSTDSILNQYQPMIQMIPHSTVSMQQLAPHIVTPTAISSTDSITNQYSQARLQITPHSMAPVQQLTPQIVAPAAIVSTDSISNQYRSAIHMAPLSTGSIQELTPQIVGPMANDINRLKFVSNSSGGAYTVLSKTCSPTFLVSLTSQFSTSPYRSKIISYYS